MPSSRQLKRVLPAAAIFLSLATAQTCYFPDGSKSADDVPCGSGSDDTSCCGSNAFCMNNGLCFTEGVVSRGSCTDKTWNSTACASYCKTSTPGGASIIIPCESAGNFACGLNSSACQTSPFTMTSGDSFILRSSQVAALVSGLDSSANSTTSTRPNTVTVTATPDLTGMHTSGAMAGLAVGLLIPLFIAAAAAFHYYRRCHARQGPRLMYALPDDCRDDYAAAPPYCGPPTAPASAYLKGGLRSPTIKDNGSSDTQSLRTMHSAYTSQKQAQQQAAPPTHMLSFMEKYAAIKENLRIQERAELDGGDSQTVHRYEMADRRMSAKSFQSSTSQKSLKSMISRS